MLVWPGGSDPHVCLAANPLGAFGLCMWPAALVYGRETPLGRPLLLLGIMLAEGWTALALSHFRDLADPIGFQDLCSTCHLAVTTVYHCTMSPWE